MSSEIKNIISLLILLVHFYFSQEFYFYNKNNKKIVFNLNNIRNNSMYIFKNHITCISCYTYLFNIANNKKYKIFLISSSSKSLNNKLQTIKEIKKIYKGKINFYFEINESTEEFMFNKPKENGIFYYFNIFKTPAVLLKVNDSLYFYNYDDIFIDNKLI